MKKIVFCIFAILTLTACHKEAVQPKVYGRYVPERKDDFAWENEYAAFRMYGPALAPENPSNGVDLWLKASPELIVDSFYYREHTLGLPYHINYGKGLDCYKVGHTVGCGGLAVVADGQVYVGGPYSTWEILEQTPERLVFRLHYDSLQVGEQVFQEDITITAQAGQLLNKAEVVISGAEAVADLLVGPGIYLHDTLETIHACLKHGTIAYAEDALSDKTAARMNYEYNGSTSQGRSYSAVILPGADVVDTIAGNALTLKHYVLGDTLTYYFGACWSEWFDGKQSFPTDKDWIQTICHMAHEKTYVYE